MNRIIMLQSFVSLVSHFAIARAYLFFSSVFLFHVINSKMTHETHEEG